MLKCISVKWEDNDEMVPLQLRHVCLFQILEFREVKKTLL